MDIKEIRRVFRTTVSGDFASQSEAEAAERKYLAAFHPVAYGTSITITHNPETGLWELRGSRSASCD